MYNGFPFSSCPKQMAISPNPSGTSIGPPSASQIVTVLGSCFARLAASSWIFAISSASLSKDSSHHSLSVGSCVISPRSNSFTSSGSLVSGCSSCSLAITFFKVLGCRTYSLDSPDCRAIISGIILLFMIIDYEFNHLFHILSRLVCAK